MAWLLIASVVALAFANGANDNFKGVATLCGSRTVGFRGALTWATATTLAGSLTALAIAGALVARFSGKGLVPDGLTTSPVFLTAVGGGAALTVLLASLLGMPISTTHALLGALLGAGSTAAAGSLNLTALTGTFVTPLVISPLLAIALVAGAYPAAGRFLRRSAAGSGTCVCSAEVRLVPSVGGSVSALPTRTSMLVVAPRAECAVHGLNPALAFPHAIDAGHFLSAGAVGFARGLNDTPKLIALLLPLQAVAAGWGAPLVAAAIAVGGFVGSKRVAQTMSHRITSMTRDQGLVANVVTAGLVLAASRFGLPVSTTHVATGSLFGLGAVTRDTRWKVIRQIMFSWVATIPIAAACSAVLWLTLQRG